MYDGTRILPACAACSAVLILVAPGACRPPHKSPRVLVFPLATRLARPSVFVHVRSFLSSAPRAWSFGILVRRVCRSRGGPRRLVSSSRSSLFCVSHADPHRIVYELPERREKNKIVVSWAPMKFDPRTENRDHKPTTNNSVYKDPRTRSRHTPIKTCNKSTCVLCRVVTHRLATARAHPRDQGRCVGSRRRRLPSQELQC